MASWVYQLIFVCITVTCTESTFAKVKCSAKNVGHYGQQSLLECVVQMVKDVTDAKIRVVTWRSTDTDEPVLVFDNGELSIQQPGYGFAEPSWNENNMNISMLITNTTVAHNGHYTCDVITSKGLAEKGQTLLEVQAKYRVPTITSNPEKILPNTHSSLTCKSYGGYPQGELRWFDGAEGDWTKSAKVKVEKTADGLFQLTSVLPLMPGSTQPTYICALFNASGYKEYETSFPTTSAQGQPGPDSLGSTSKVVAPVVVIGSLLVGLLMALLLYRRRSQMARRPSAAPLMGFGAVPKRDIDVEDCHCPEMVEEPKDNMA